MHRLRRFIVLLIVGVLGLQTGAFAAHAHLAAAQMQVGHEAHSAPHTSAHAADQRHDPIAHQGMGHADADGGTSHHSTSCASAQSCFPVGNAPTVAVTAPALLPVAPAAAPPMAVPAAHPQRLLRPPQLHG